MCNNSAAIGRLGQCRGMTLVELMVALAIGLFLMIGAITVLLQGRMTFRVSETISRLQENARFALDALEPDIRMAHYWGLTTRPQNIEGRALQGGTASVLGPHDCGNNWHLDVELAVQGTDGTYTWACLPAVGNAMAGADTLVIRRASQNPVVPAAGWLHLQSARVQDSRIFLGATVPAGYIPATSQTHRLVVNGYYVSTASSLGNTVPSLRRKTLGAGPAIRDEEILAGVEDMQIQFGVDTDIAGAVNRGVIDRYVDPDDPILDRSHPSYMEDAEILAVRIWLRIRSDRPETGYTDTATYSYAGQNVGPFNDGFRRLVVSKTIYLRNARPPM
ncbi:MAG TPA: PilW family protein [Gammaproteobacteria bacterium]